MRQIYNSLLKFNILRYIISLFIILCIISYLAHEYVKKRVLEITRYSQQSQIDTLISLNFGGIEQWILLRGENDSAPIMLILHGGPGALLFPSARNYGKNTGIDRIFVTVYWEQPGTGKSYQFNVPDTALSINRLVEYAHDVTKYLLNTYNKAQIYLMGRSFGSLIGMLLIQKYPQDFFAFISISQFVNTYKNDSISYDIAIKWAQNTQNEKAIEELKSVGPPPYNPEELLVQRKWVTFLHDSKLKIKRPDYMTELLSTPEYTLFDIFLIGFDPLYSLRALWTSDIYSIDLYDLVPSVKVPVYFIVGQHDIISSPILIQSYFKKLEAPAGKQLYIFDSSGHEPDISEPQAFVRIITHDVIKNHKSIQSKLVQ